MIISFDMTTKAAEDEFTSLSKYMIFYIQMLPFSKECGGNKFFAQNIPSFDKWKRHWSEPYLFVDVICEGHINYCCGIGALKDPSVKKYRYWDSYLSIKFFTESINGEYTYFPNAQI